MMWVNEHLSNSSMGVERKIPERINVRRYCRNINSTWLRTFRQKLRYMDTLSSRNYLLTWGKERGSRQLYFHSPKKPILMTVLSHFLASEKVWKVLGCNYILIGTRGQFRINNNSNYKKTHHYSTSRQNQIAYYSYSYSYPMKLLGVFSSPSSSRPLSL